MSKEIIQVSTDVLKVHPRNAEFFDDIQGEDYDRFKDSIKNDGLLSPILVSPDMTVISGHQRLKACKELGINLVPIMIKDDLTDEDEKLKLLLAANFGRNKNDEAKQRKIAVEYVNLCGYKNGEAGRGRKLSENRKAISEIAKDLNVSVSTLYEMIEIDHKLTPEMKELLDKDKLFTKTTASKIIAKLSADEQEELVKKLPITEKLTQKQVQHYVNQLKAAEQDAADYKAKADKANFLSERIEWLETELDKAKDKQPEIVTKEVAPSDYESLKADNSRMASEYQAKVQELLALKEKLRAVEEDSTRTKVETELEKDCIFFCSRCDDFIKKVGGYAYLTDKLNMLPENEKKSYIKCVQVMAAWAQNILTSMNDTENI